VVHLTADRARERPPRTVEWTTQVPPTARLGPENIMTKPQKLSAEAEAAVTEMDFWSLFFTQEVVSVIFGLIRFFILLLSTSFISTQMILKRVYRNKSFEPRVFPPINYL
jgi:hypothetical protein